MKIIQREFEIYVFCFSLFLQKHLIHFKVIWNYTHFEFYIHVIKTLFYFMKPPDYTYYAYFLYLRSLQRVGMFYRGQSSIAFFIYGSIHFGPKNGLGIVTYIGSFFFIFDLNIFLLQYKGIGIGLTTGFIVTYIGLTNDNILTTVTVA